MSNLFICLGSGYIILCLLMILIIIFQNKQSSGLGNLAGMRKTYWDKNKKNSLEGKLESWTKFMACLYFVFTFVICMIK